VSENVCPRCNGERLLQVEGMPAGVQAACPECGGSGVYRAGCRWPLTDCACDLPAGVVGTDRMSDWHYKGWRP
jgi:hypothetical protein